jgi:hypothetical protein
VFFHSHIRQETEVVLLNDDSTAARTEFAFWTMFIEDQWRLHSAFLLFHYLYDGMPHGLQNFCERHCDDFVLRTADQLAAAGRVTTESIEGERVKSQYALIKKRYFLISDKSNRAISKMSGVSACETERAG